MRADRPAGAKTAVIQPLLWVFQVVPLGVGWVWAPPGVLRSSSSRAWLHTPPHCFKAPIASDARF